MKKTTKILVIVFVLVFAFLLYYNLTTKWHPGPDETRLYKGIEGAEIPGCVEFKDDVCGLFDCMVDMCWCDDSSPDLPILYEKEGISIANENEAVSYVQKFVDDNNPTYTVKRAVKLNNVFFNVFAENEAYDELVYTVAVDGTIMKTICGV